MPRDYAKKKKAPQKKRGASRSRKKKATVPLGLWLFTVALVVGLAGGLVYLKWYQPPPAPLTVKTNKPSQPQSSKPLKNAQEPNKAKYIEDEVPVYDLHEDLTNKQVVIPKEDLELPKNYKKFFYTMPCGSFREVARAEELKARIALAGSNSSLNDVQSKGETWYRVQLGPFKSKRTAEKIRHRLQDNGIHDCVINRHIKPDT